jgi:hypothetical protein
MVSENISHKRKLICHKSTKCKQSRILTSKQTHLFTLTMLTANKQQMAKMVQVFG